VSYDRANYETALAVWLEKAKTGDAKAQTYVGEIYEKGMGRPPDYKEAAKWYQRGADQEYSPAQTKLGLLYEKGLGVDQNKEMALQLYRRASGLEDLGVQFGASTEIGKLKEDLINQRNEVREQQLQLNDELERLTRERKQFQEERERMEEERKKLQEIEPSPINEELVAKDQRLAQKEHDLKGKEEQIDALSLKLENQKQSLEARARDLFKKRQELTRQELDNPPENEKLSPIKNFNIDYGKSYALIIGISKYKNLDPLQTAANDAKEIEKVLKAKYDFTHIDLLVDERATHDGITKKLIFYQKNLGAQDNFLIYYAGHGKLENGEGYWLPVDAHNDQHMKTNWISNKDVSGLASNFQAKHVIIVADSCYSGAIATQGATPWFPSDLSDDKQKMYYEQMARKHGVRMSLTSGGLKPVYDSLGGSHSFFAEALLTVLGKGQDLAKFDHFPEPRFNSLNMSDQSIGQFFFVLKS
jgi:TPR repeat protein